MCNNKYFEQHLNGLFCVPHFFSTVKKFQQGINQFSRYAYKLHVKMTKKVSGNSSVTKMWLLREFSDIKPIEILFYG